MKLSMAMLGALFAAVAAAVEVDTLNGSNLLGLVRSKSEGPRVTKPRKAGRPKIPP